MCLQVADPDERSTLWLALIQHEIDSATSHHTTSPDSAAHPSSHDSTPDLADPAVDTHSPESIERRVAAVDRCVGDRLVQGALAVEDALGLLPEQNTLRHYKAVLLKHMEATSLKVRLRMLCVGLGTMSDGPLLQGGGAEAHGGAVAQGACFEASSMNCFRAHRVKPTECKDLLERASSFIETMLWQPHNRRVIFVTSTKIK